MNVVAQSLCSIVYGSARAVEDAYLIAPFVFYHTMHLNTEIKASTDIWCQRIKRVGQYDGCCKRCRQGGEESLSEGCHIGMTERSLEFSHSETHFLACSIVNPCLLQYVASRSCRIDTHVVVNLSECPASETNDCVWHRETGVGHIVLIVGLVQSAVVVIVIVAGCLYIHIWLEHEVALLRLQCKSAVVGNRYHAVVHVQCCLFCFLFLCHGSGRSHCN